MRTFRDARAKSIRPWPTATARLPVDVRRWATSSAVLTHCVGTIKLPHRPTRGTHVVTTPPAAHPASTGSADGQPVAGLQFTGIRRRQLVDGPVGPGEELLAGGPGSPPCIPNGPSTRCCVSIDRDTGCRNSMTRSSPSPPDCAALASGPQTEPMQSHRKPVLEELRVGDSRAHVAVRPSTIGSSIAP